MVDDKFNTRTLEWDMPPQTPEDPGNHGKNRARSLKLGSHANIPGCGRSISDVNFASKSLAPSMGSGALLNNQYIAFEVVYGIFRRAPTCHPCAHGIS